MRIVAGLFLFPVWIVAMLVVYPPCWLGARAWHLMTGDYGPLENVESWGWAHR